MRRGTESSLRDTSLQSLSDGNRIPALRGSLLRHRLCVRGFWVPRSISDQPESLFNKIAALELSWLRDRRVP